MCKARVDAVFQQSNSVSSILPLSSLLHEDSNPLSWQHKRLESMNYLQKNITVKPHTLFATKRIDDVGNFTYIIFGSVEKFVSYFLKTPSFF